MPRARPREATASWDGRTYYGRRSSSRRRSTDALVGSYVFLAGLSGAAQLLATALDLARGRERASRPSGAGDICRCWRRRSAALCLILDLHTPQRFYNMLRVFKSDLADVARLVDPGDVRRLQRSHRRRAIRRRPGAGFRLAAPAGAGRRVAGRRRGDGDGHLHGVAALGDQHAALGGGAEAAGGAVRRVIASRPRQRPWGLASAAPVSVATWTASPSPRSPSSLPRPWHPRTATGASTAMRWRARPWEPRCRSECCSDRWC